MDDYDDTGDYAPDDDEYHTEEEANGHDEDEEDVEQAKMENALYKSDDENEEPSEDEYEEDGILGIEKEQEDNVDDLAAEEKVAAVKKKEPVSKVVPPEKRKTNPIMTKFEYTNLIAWRAQMIENTNSPLMIPDTKFTNSIDIAREETEKGVNPIIIVRNLPNGFIEEWKCSELSLPKSFK